MLAPEVLFEDQDVLVLNKPAGLTVHPDNFLPPTAGSFLITWLIEKYPEIRSVGDNPTRPGIVHRLDKDTSGVMVVAKNKTSYDFLKQQFKDRQIEKTYLGLVTGEFKAGVGATGEIDLPIGRSLKDARVRVASNKAHGQLRAATTLYKVLAQGSGYALVELKPLTGRTHQLRAHLKALQHPIVCDALYGTDDNCPAGLKRQALHARTLKFILPSGGARQFTAPLPTDLETVLAQLKFTC